MPPNIARVSTAQELQQLAAWFHGQGPDESTSEELVANAYVAVYDEYCTGSPGYCGKLMSVVWDGGPTFFDVFTWNDDVLEQNEHDYDEKRCTKCGARNATLCVNCLRQWSNQVEGRM